jgi:hypothetical protein
LEASAKKGEKIVSFGKWIELKPGIQEETLKLA